MSEGPLIESESVQKRIRELEAQLAEARGLLERLVFKVPDYPTYERARAFLAPKPPAERQTIEHQGPLQQDGRWTSKPPAKALPLGHPFRRGIGSFCAEWVRKHARCGQPESEH